MARRDRSEIINAGMSPVVPLTCRTYLPKCLARMKMKSLYRETVQTCPLSTYNIVSFDDRLCALEGWRQQGIFCHGLLVAVGQVVFRTTR